MKKAMDLVHEQKIDLKRLITHRFSLYEIDRAFNLTEVLQRIKVSNKFILSSIYCFCRLW